MFFLSPSWKVIFNSKVTFLLLQSKGTMDALQTPQSALQAPAVLQITLLKWRNKLRSYSAKKYIGKSQYLSSLELLETIPHLVQLPFWSQQYEHMTTALIWHWAKSQIRTARRWGALEWLTWIHSCLREKERLSIILHCTITHQKEQFSHRQIPIDFNNSLGRFYARGTGPDLFACCELLLVLKTVQQ